MNKVWGSVIEECQKTSEATGAVLPALFTDVQSSGQPVGRHMADVNLFNQVMAVALVAFLRNVNERLEKGGKRGRRQG